jgi:hypothetical protein
MSILNQVTRNAAPGAPKGIIYGPPGIGKTTFGASAPGALILDCENGANALPVARTPYLCSWSEMAEWMNALICEQHQYGVVAIDSLDWMMRRIEEHASGSTAKVSQTLNQSHGGYGNGKQVLRNYVYQCLLPQLDRLVARGLAVILLAHARRSEIMDVDGITTEKITPELSADYLPIFVEWADFVCLARKDSEGNRVLVTNETPRALAKNRYSMPETVPLEWPAFTDAIAAGLANQFPIPTNTNTEETAQ